MKSDMRKKMSVIASTTIDNDEDLALPQHLWEKVREKGFENVGDRSDDDISEGSDEFEKESDEDHSGEEYSEEEDSESEDEGAARVEAMA